HLHEQIVEVHGVAGDQTALVLRVDAAHNLAEIVAGVVAARLDNFVLGGGNGVEDSARLEALRIDIHVAQNRLDHGELVVGVVDYEVTVVGRAVDLDAQEAGADRVEGAQLHAERVTEQLFGTFAHFARGFVGEGHGDHVAFRDAFLNHVGDPVCQYAGFAAA